MPQPIRTRDAPFSLSPLPSPIVTVYYSYYSFSLFSLSGGLSWASFLFSSSFSLLSLLFLFFTFHLPLSSQSRHSGLGFRFFHRNPVLYSLFSFFLSHYCNLLPHPPVRGCAPINFPLHPPVLSHAHNCSNFYSILSFDLRVGVLVRWVKSSNRSCSGWSVNCGALASSTIIASGLFPYSVRRRRIWVVDISGLSIS